MADDIQHPTRKPDPTPAENHSETRSKPTNPEHVYLFVSRARGDFLPGSDYDQVIIPDDAPPERHQGCLTAQVLIGLILPVNFLKRLARLPDECKPGRPANRRPKRGAQALSIGSEME